MIWHIALAGRTLPEALDASIPNLVKGLQYFTMPNIPFVQISHAILKYVKCTSFYCFYSPVYKMYTFFQEVHDLFCVFQSL